MTGFTPGPANYNPTIGCLYKLVTFPESLSSPAQRAILCICYICCPVVAKLYPTLCNIMDCSLPGSSSLSMGFPRQEYWSGLPFPSPRDLPHPGIEPTSAAWQEDSTTESPAKPPVTYVPMRCLPEMLSTKPNWCLSSLFANWGLYS